MIIAVLQARVSSRRLPGKVLQPILGRPMLARQIERLSRCRRFDTLVLATSDQAADDPLEAIGRDCGVPVYRGSLDDVLDRFYRAAEPYSPGHVVRLTGDCPLIDWAVVDDVVAFAIESDYDYASNTLKPTWPDGLDVEVARFSALTEAWREATLAVDREHVMPFLHRQPERFRLGNLENTIDLSGLRWTVDEPRDFQMVNSVYEALYPRDPAFGTAQILDFLRAKPSIAGLNSDIARNEGYQLTLANHREQNQ